jgi:hypothetical protein
LQIGNTNQFQFSYEIPPNGSILIDVSKLDLPGPSTFTSAISSDQELRCIHMMPIRMERLDNTPTSQLAFAWDLDTVLVERADLDTTYQPQDVIAFLMPPNEDMQQNGVYIPCTLSHAGLTLDRNAVKAYGRSIQAISVRLFLVVKGKILWSQAITERAKTRNPLFDPAQSADDFETTPVIMKIALAEIS